tara:strand:+ start:618 stop:803 length:186 start_codon:yes stop_codon:yes gene_type:complete
MSKHKDEDDNRKQVPPTEPTGKLDVDEKRGKGGIKPQKQKSDDAAESRPVIEQNRLKRNLR